MKNIELKNCPNCHERIGKQDIECPYCKYIDDPKYKKYNEKLMKSKKNIKNKKNNIYKLLLFIPILTYLVYLLFDLDSAKVIIPLILLDVMCFFTKKKLLFVVMLIEVIALSVKFISSISNMFLNDSFKGLGIEIIIFILGVIFIIIPKLIFLIKSKKKRRKTRKK